MKGPVIAPMTVKPRYFEEIIGRLRAEGGHEVRHFALLAERRLVLRRLSERGLGRGRPAGQLRRPTPGPRLERLSGPEFAEHIHTDELTVPQVADRVAASAGLRPRPTPTAPCATACAAPRIGLRHIRFD